MIFARKKNKIIDKVQIVANLKIKKLSFADHLYVENHFIVVTVEIRIE